MRRVPIGRHLASTGIAPADDPRVRTIAALLRRRVRGASGGLWDLTAPLPPVSRLFEGRVSPRLALLLLKALDVRAGDRVLLSGDPLVFVAACLQAMPRDVRPAEVVHASLDPARAYRTAERIGTDVTDSARGTIVDVRALEAFRPRSGADETDRDAHPEPALDAMRGPFDRVVLFGASWSPWTADAFLADGGFALLVDTTPGRLRFTQRMRVSDITTEMDLLQHRFGGAAEAGRKGRRIARLLLAERLSANVWTGGGDSRLERGITEVVERTFADNPYAYAADPRRVALARKVFHLAYTEQGVGDLQAAEDLYRASLSVAETAEGWTFYGWVRSMRGSIDEAIDACRRAISVDPGFGNPYNDIGAYLLERGELGPSKAWFHRATQAVRYAAPYYPFLNLGRVFLSEGDLPQARAAVQRALDVAPGYAPAEKLLREIVSREGRDLRGR